MKQLVLAFWLVILTTACSTPGDNVRTPVKLLKHSDNGSVRFDLNLRRGVTNLWDAVPMYTIFVRDVSRSNFAPTHVIQMCGNDKVCVLESVSGSNNLYGEEIYRGSVILEDDVASFKIPIEFLPEKSYIWSEYRNMESVTFADELVLPASDLSKIADRNADPFADPLINRGPSFVDSVSRDQLTSNDLLAFEVRFAEADYEKYLVHPDHRVFKIYLDVTTKNRGADISIQMCGATNVCMYGDEGGSYVGELYRTDATVKDGRIMFAIESGEFPDAAVWGFISMDKSLWSMAIVNDDRTVMLPKHGGSRALRIH